MARTKQDVIANVALLRQQKKRINVQKVKNSSKKLAAVCTRSSTRAKLQTANEADNSVVVTTPDPIVQVKNFECNHCQKSYTTKSNLNQHVKTIHDNGQGGIRRFICPYCDSEQSSKFSLQRHIQRKHADESIENLSENEHTKTDNVNELTETASIALITRLKNENDTQKREIEYLKHQLAQYEMIGTSQQKVTNMSTSSQPTTNEIANSVTSTELQQRNKPIRRPKQPKKTMIPRTIANAIADSIISTELQRPNEPNRQPNQPNKPTISRKTATKIGDANRSSQQLPRRIKIELNTEIDHTQQATQRLKRNYKPKKDDIYIYTI